MVLRRVLVKLRGGCWRAQVESRSGGLGGEETSEGAEAKRTWRGLRVLCPVEVLT